MDQRLERARELIGESRALLFTGRSNIAYLSGFTGTEASLLIGRDEAVIFVDSRYTTQATQETGMEVHQISKRWEDIRTYLLEKNLLSIGLESNTVDYDTATYIITTLKDIEVKPMGKALRDLRRNKDRQEADLIGKASDVAMQALKTVLDRGLIGRREQDVALDMEFEMRRMGAQAVSFELIVASGERSAMPHGVASPRIIGPDEPVVIDFGCIYQGYCSDETVTVFTGEPDAEFSAVYAKVYEAQMRAVAGLAPGVKTADIDALARGYLEEQGLAKFFGHGLGHGVGREVHEAPGVSGMSEDTLEPGMVITIEPGVYFPGRFGIRLEDCFLITDTSCQRLTNMPKGACTQTT